MCEYHSKAAEKESKLSQFDRKGKKARLGEGGVGRECERRTTKCVRISISR